MKESVLITKAAHIKEDFSPTRSNKSALHVRTEPVKQLGSLRDVIDTITRDGSTPSHDSIATELGSMPTAQRASALLELQHTHGNRYVQQVVAGIQAKLMVNPAGDIYEREADRVAKQVVEQINQPVSQPLSQIVQRRELEEEEEEELLQGKFETVQRQEPEEEEEELIQGKHASGLTGTLQAKPEAPQNKTGMPDHLKAGIENLSGMSMDDVKVHYNSSKPQHLNALAYTQGQDIHVAPGQEKRLPHEGWHAVQQMQGRVKPTMQAEGVPINDDHGLEREADMMGAKALQMRGADQVTTGPIADATTVEPGQREPTEASGVPGAAITASGEKGRLNFLSTETEVKSPSIGRVFQLADKMIGHNVPPDPVINRIQIVRDLGHTHTYRWPADDTNVNFDANDYKGSVDRALRWGLAGGEGTAGWFTREYSPEQFNRIANAAHAATLGLEGNPALNNERNKTLVAIRAFRGGPGGEMAENTGNDLVLVYNAMMAARAALNAAGLINNAGAAITEVRADPAEAHPNTLPTARITFGGVAGTVYFKGRSGAVENALVGTNNSAAVALNTLDANPVGAEMGTHTFSSTASTHVAQDVGPPAQPGGVDMNSALLGWVTAAKTAALVALTATGDLHTSNVLLGQTQKKHIIDAEFLLDSTMWADYEAAAASNKVVNFEITEMAAPWVLEFTRSLPDNIPNSGKGKLAMDVANRFKALGLYQGPILDQVLAPLQTLIDSDALLRVSPNPFSTQYWLRTISDYHNTDDKEEFVAQQWENLKIVYPDDFKIALLRVGTNPKEELRQNFDNGMVPLFHLAADSGLFYLNKHLFIGRIDQNRQARRLLALAKTMLANGREDLWKQIWEAVLDA